MKTNLSIAIMIPARYQSSRLPGKPLVDLCGKSMIQRTWGQCLKNSFDIPVYVATDSEEIASHVNTFGGKVVFTSPKCLTGTDRLAEANKKLNYDLVVNVQGDEPIIEPSDIDAVIKEALASPDTIVNGMARIDTEKDFFSNTVPKVVFDNDQNLLYMSRSPIPGNKSSDFKFGYKQVCIYSFSREHLNFFSSLSQKSVFEKVEDIEILRFLEYGFKIKMIRLSGDSVAVDVPSDIDRVIKIISSSSL